MPRLNHTAAHRRGVEGRSERSAGVLPHRQQRYDKAERGGRRLAGSATRLWLASPCDRDLTIVAAAKVVAQNEEKIKRFLEASFEDAKAKRL